MTAALFGRDLFTTKFSVFNGDVTDTQNTQYPPCEVVDFFFWTDDTCSNPDSQYDDDFKWDNVLLPMNRAIQWGACLAALDESYYFKVSCNDADSVIQTFYSDPECTWFTRDPAVTYGDTTITLIPREVLTDQCILSDDPNLPGSYSLTARAV